MLIHIVDVIYVLVDSGSSWKQHQFVVLSLLFIVRLVRALVVIISVVSCLEVTRDDSR
jgi:hypothetical protein